MLQNRRKETFRIAAAFGLLCVVSAYRQISLHFFPNDPLRPTIVFLVYLLLLVVWWISIRLRVTQRNMRAFLLAEHAIMLIGISTRYVQDAVLYQDTYLMRLSGYLVAVPMVLIPVLGLYATFDLQKSEDYQINRNWYWLLLPTTVLVALLLTNELHHLVFRLLEGETKANLYFHPNIGIFILIFWAFFLELIRIFLIYRSSRKLEGRAYLKASPLLIAVFMLVFSLGYILSSFVVTIELIEYSVFMFFLEIMIWESCIAVGMVPVNTHYEEVFDRSTVAMQIIDTDGQVCLKSACASDLSAELLAQLKLQTHVHTPEGQELHLHAIRGGYTVWQSDISQTLAVIDALKKSTDRLEQEGEFLRQELKIRSDEEAVKEQNRIYNQLTDEVGEQLALLRAMLGKREWVQDKALLFRQICLLGTYVKRRCNLRLVEQSDGQISNEELALCYRDLISGLDQLGVKAAVSWRENVPLAPEFALFTLHVFESLLEHERFVPQAVTATYEASDVFSVRVQSASAARGHSHAGELQRLRKEGFDVHWQQLEDGYEIIARIEGCL